MINNELGTTCPLGIAIIGISCRFPGANSVEAFWENLRQGVESVTFFSDEELIAAGVDPTWLTDPNYVKAGTLLSDIDLFDAAFFGLTPREAKILDPQQRLFLECAHEALERAGYAHDAYRGTIGIYAGMAMSEYFFSHLASNSEVLEEVDGYSLLLANDKDYLPTRIAYKLNLKGPSVTVQTACSTSLVATHLACQSLLNGECHLALAGGVTIQIPQKQGYLYQEGMIASPDGHCRPFDAKAQGTIGGNGMGIVLLKPLEEALADGDMIYAVIKGSAINNDGSAKVGYTAPSVEGQVQVIREAQAVAEVTPETITYIETHGTGTVLGDPIEIAALTQAFQQGAQGDNPKSEIYSLSRRDPKSEIRNFPWCAIGSVKSNIGHADTAAGVAGLIKTALALKHGQIPPSLHFESPNPKIGFANSPFYVNTELSDWPSLGEPRRAGVSSFGIGGTNAHLILEEAPPLEPSSKSKATQLLLLSAKTSKALDTMSANLAAYLAQHPDQNLADVAYTLQVGRDPYPYRRMVLCKTIDEAISQLRDQHFNTQRAGYGFHKEGQPTVVFMFSGQGSQYVNMAQELYAHEATFREAVDHCATLLEPHLGLDIRDLLYPSPLGERVGVRGEATQQLKQTALTQPILFVIEYALAQLWREWGVLPEAMIGHSIGEYVAACLAGVFTLPDALTLVARRGQLMQSLPEGAMLAVSRPVDELSLPEGISLAAVNTPTQCVYSGSTDSIAAFEQQLARAGIESRRLHTSHAFHSAMMEPILQQFAAYVSTFNLQPPQIPYLSNVSGTWITDQEATDPHYWARHLRQTVRFADGLGELLQEPELILLEVGPGRTLSTLAKRHPARKEQVILRSLRHPREAVSDTTFLLTTLGQLWLAGGDIDWYGFYANEKRHRLLLPTYPFERQRYWIEPPETLTQKQSGENRKSKACADEGSIENRQSKIEKWFYVPSWKRSTLPLGNHSSRPSERTCWLLFVDSCGLGQQLANRLEEAEQEVITVQIGSGLTKLSERSYMLAPQKPASYSALLQDLLAQGKRPQKIVHLWNVTGATNSLDMASLEAIQALGFYSLLSLAQALGTVRLTEEIQITVITNNMQQVTGEEELCPEKATILGPVKAIPQEYSNIRCRSIDVVFNAGSQQLVDNLLTELTLDHSDPSLTEVIAYRGRYRWQQIFEPIRLESQPPALLRQEGVYLITGGLGGIGLTLAAYLASFQAKLILIGRSAFPEREEWEEWLSKEEAGDRISPKIRQLQALEAAGAEVLVLRADVAKIADMQAAVSQAEARFGSINGVIHAAGVPSNGMILRKTPSDAAAVLAPKVHGTLVLADALNALNDQPDFLVLCSSMSAVLSGVGQVDYTAANAFQDAFAHASHVARFTTAINWDAWQEVGMAVNAAASHQNEKLAEALKEGILPHEGQEVFSRILSSGLSQVLVSTVALQPLLEEAQQPSSMLERASDLLQPVVTTTHARPQLQTAYVAPRNADEELIADVWQRFLGIEPIGIHDNFFEDLAGDSLAGMSLTNQLQKRLGATIHIAALFDNPTVAEMAAYLREHYADKLVRQPKEVQEVLGLSVPLSPREERVDADKVAEFRQWLTTLLPPPYPKGTLSHQALSPGIRAHAEHAKRKNPSAIFILSPARSGSTLLRVILAGHSHLFAPPELGLLAYETLAEMQADGGSPGSFVLEGIIRAIMQIKRYDATEATAFIQEAVAQQYTTQQFYALLQEAIGKKRLVDKTPTYAYHLELLKRAEAYFENARYIHLLRHPYGMIRSYEEARLDLLMPPHSFSTLELAELTWLVSHQNILDFLQDVPPSRHYRVQFEELLQAPDATVKGICDFLKLDFEPEMLQIYSKDQPSPPTPLPRGEGSMLFQPSKGDQSERMIDGIYAESRMIGDFKLRQHKKIDPKVANQWQQQITVDFLGELTWQMAETVGYERWAAPTEAGETIEVVDVLAYAEDKEEYEEFTL